MRFDSISAGNQSGLHDSIGRSILGVVGNINLTTWMLIFMSGLSCHPKRYEAGRLRLMQKNASLSLVIVWCCAYSLFSNTPVKGSHAEVCLASRNALRNAPFSFGVAGTENSNPQGQ